MARGPEARLRLRRAIHFVDRLLSPRGGNCYRRALLEVSLDSQAATEPFMFGLKAGGRARSGHVWLGSAMSRDEGAGAYDCVVSV